MTEQTWTLRLDPTAKDQVENWLRDEDLLGYKLKVANNTLEIELQDIDTAFRFRMQFDEELVN